MNHPAAPPHRSRKRIAIHLALFLLTLASTWFVGAGGFALIELWIAGLLGTVLDSGAIEGYFAEMAQSGFYYMASIMSILLSHEMGHYVMARKNRVDASLPYFIPMPFLLFGTLGAVILMKGRIRSRNALMEVGAAGPLAGMAVALPVLAVGLSLSEVGPVPENALVEGQSILYVLLKRAVIGEIPSGHDVLLHPMAWAGWIGLLVTMLNLLPIGQLDGGHVFYALFGDAHARVSRAFLVGLFVLGIGIMSYSALEASALGLEGDAYWSHVLVGMNWLVLGLLLVVVFGRKKGRGVAHPPTDDHTLSRAHRIVGVACLVLFVVTFMPVPIRMVV